MAHSDPSDPPPARHRPHRPSIPPPGSHAAPHPPQQNPNQDPSVAPPLGEEQSGSPSSSLDPDEITVRFHPPCTADSPTPHAIELNQTFRHSFWRRRRWATYEALHCLEAGRAVLDRFDGCGSAAWVLQDKDDPNNHRLATNRCRHRWCEACAGDRRRVITRNLATRLPTDDLRLLTLTLKSTPGDLHTQLDRLYDCFRQFRRHRDIRDRMTGGIYFLELTFNDRTEMWHPHLHVLFAGSYLPHAIAKQTWLDLTGDSFIVDVRQLRDRRGAATYVAKYASKSVAASVWTSPSRLCQAMLALEGRRTFQTFGDWRELQLSKPLIDDVVWEPLCTLADLITRAQAGEQDARRILSEIAANHHLEAFDLGNPSPDTS